jgi:hypothetical protein
MRNHKLFTLLLVVFFSIFTHVHAQAIAPPTNPTPLEHPLPLTSLRTKDVRSFLIRLTETINEAGFKVVRNDTNSLLIDAKRFDSPQAKDYDRVLVWLERGHVDPLVTFDLYLAYGRYQEILGEAGTPRVLVDPDWEDAQVGTLKQSLIELSNELGE